ncbi:hypothetical protein BOX15_Mlig017121g1 [Macrostomum lignano]|uniref:Nucleoside diphosphate kinase-like domain-containing protein n=1 Tax=Macrostomum lignano TaxID=282301 RepID=A0A267FCV8_9PLAT|nr:hypothetical protein BOX15_Mlig017121g1 [Macrostomum lignano]
MDSKEENELSFKLPEIHFSDDDDDETSSTGGSNIQIFSRPTLGNEESGDIDLSFLDDSNSLDWQDEAEVGDNSDMAVDFPEPVRDIASGFWSAKEDSAEMQKPYLSTTTQSTSSGTQCDADQSTVPKRFASAGTSTAAASPGAPALNASTEVKKSTTLASSAGRSHGGSWAPLKLGDVADAQLSKVLDQLQLPDEPADIDIASLTAEPDAARNDELLRQLSQHSLMFSGSRQPKPQPAPPASRSPASTSTAVATSTTNSSSGAAAYADSLTDRALQAMEASAKRQTVRVDLRHSQAASLQMSDLLRFGPTLLDSSEAKADATAVGDNHRESSSEDEDDSAAGGLWLDSYRRAKQAGWPANSHANSKRPPAQKVSTTAFAGTKTSPVAGGDAASDKDSQPKENGLSKTASTGQHKLSDDSAANSALKPENVSMAAPQTLSPAADLEKKLQAMRQREAELSRRRSLLLALRDLAPNLVAVGLEPVAHDDVSFTEPAPEPLDPSCRQSENLLLLEARLSPCGQLLGVNGQPLDVVDTARDASYHCLLVWLLSLSAAQPKPTDPLHILGLRQLADCGSGQLRLQVAAHANRDMPLHRYLSDTNLHQACSAWFNAEFNDLFVSRHPLSTLLSLSRSMDGRSLASDRVSMFWCPLRREPSGLVEHWPPCSLPMEASVLELDRDLAAAQPARMLRLLRSVASAGCDLAGVRMIYSAAKSQAATLAIAVRGCGAVTAMRSVAASGGVFEGRRDGWAVSRYAESVPRELARYFGGRLSPKMTQSQVRALAPDREDLSCVARLLTAAPLEDVAMLASPLVTEIGWVIHLASESGFALIGCRRVQLHRDELANLLGMADSQAACFSNGVACVLLLRRENALHHAGAFIQNVVKEIKSRRELGVPASLLFFAMPCLSAVLQTVHCTRIDSLPKLKSDAHRPDEPRYADQEQLAVLIVSGRNFQAIAAELLDQLAEFELLGLKCLPRFPQLHAHFVAEQLLGGSGGGSEWRAAKPLMELPALTFVIRGVGLMHQLDAIAPHYPACSDYRLLHSISWHQAYCLTRNLFADFELFECSERRPCLLTCPPPEASGASAEAATVLAQLRHPGPDRVVTHSYLLLSNSSSGKGASNDDQRWHLRAVARAARLVARDAFELDWLGLVRQLDTDEFQCAVRLQRENSVSALMCRRSALVEVLPARVAVAMPTNWQEVNDVEKRLGIDRLIATDFELLAASQQQQSAAASRYAANPSPPSTATAAGDCTGLLWRLPAADALPLLARLCDLLHRRGVRLIGLRSLRLEAATPGQCASLGRDLRLHRLEAAGHDGLSRDGGSQRRQVDAVLNNRNELIPGNYLVFILEGNLVSLGLRNYLNESMPPDTAGLLPQLGHPSVVYQTEDATAAAAHLANRLCMPLLPNDLIVCLDNN